MCTNLAHGHLGKFKLTGRKIRVRTAYDHDSRVCHDFNQGQLEDKNAKFVSCLYLSIC